MPDPTPDQVIVKQFASGICHSQLHQMHNPALRTPLLLGHESTGIVLAKGANVTHVNEGDHVMVTWIPRAVDPGQPRPQPSTVTFRRETLNTGVFTWTETTIVHYQFVVTLDKSYPTQPTAVIGCAAMTGCGAALNTVKVERGNSVAVFGVGGVGLCIVQTCSNIGAYPIIAVDISDDKLAFARRFGATASVNATLEDPVTRIRDLSDGGVDYAFDAVGIPKTIEQVLPSVRAGVGGVSEGGTAVLVGVPQTTVTLNMRDLFSGRTFKGSIGGSSRPQTDFPIYLRWLKEGKLPLDLLVTQRFKLEQVNEACHALERGQIAGRAILVFDGD